MSTKYKILEGCVGGDGEQVKKQLSKSCSGCVYSWAACDGGWACETNLTVWLPEPGGSEATGRWSVNAEHVLLLLVTGSAQCCPVFASGRGHTGGYSTASVLLQIQTPVPSQCCVHRGMPLITLNRQMHDADWKFQTYGHARSFVSLVGEALEMSWGVTKTCCYPRSAFAWCVSTCLR